MVERLLSILLFLWTRLETTNGRVKMMDRRVISILLFMTLFLCLGLLYHTSTNIDLASYEVHIPYRTNTSIRSSSYFYSEYTATRDPKEESLGPTPVVILTYARSGSSFLGDLIRLSDDVIYLFEPLHFLRFSDPLMYFNRSSRKTVFGIREAKEVIKNILTCSFTELPLQFWNGAFMIKHSHQIRYFYAKNGLAIRRRITHPEQFRLALENFQMECKRTKAVVIKTIRTPLFVLSRLLSSIPNLKVVHLMRDPRPTTLSQSQHIVHFNSFSTHANQLCTRILNDVSVANMLSVFYPNNIIRVRYEFVAKFPIKMAKLLYNYLMLSFTDKIIQSIYDMTSTGETVEGVLSTTKGNSSAEIDKWREKISMRYVQFVDDQCRTLYHKVGYLAVANETVLRDKTIPLFYKLEKASGNGNTDKPYLVDFFTDERMTDELMV